MIKIIYRFNVVQDICIYFIQKVVGIYLKYLNNFRVQGDRNKIVNGYLNIIVFYCFIVMISNYMFKICYFLFLILFDLVIIVLFKF